MASQKVMKIKLPQDGVMRRSEFDVDRLRQQFVDAGRTLSDEYLAELLATVEWLPE